LAHRRFEVTPMQVPLQITVRNMQQSDALEAHIRDKVAKLAEFHPRITSCRVTVEQSARHHHKGRPFQVRVDVRVPQHELVATRSENEDVYVALRDAFDAIRRQLEDVARQSRGDVKTHAGGEGTGETPGK
jgi:ribosomal subunit interface protein